MHANTKVIQCTTREGFHARFKQLDPFHNETSGVDVRSDPVFIERRAKEMAREYAANSAPLRHWVQQGNKLPEIYR